MLGTEAAEHFCPSRGHGPGWPEGRPWAAWSMSRARAGWQSGRRFCFFYLYKPAFIQLGEWTPPQTPLGLGNKPVSVLKWARLKRNYFKRIVSPNRGDDRCFRVRGLSGFSLQIFTYTPHKNLPARSSLKYDLVNNVSEPFWQKWLLLSHTLWLSCSQKPSM